MEAFPGSIQEILASKQVKFIVGPEQKVFTIHIEAAVRQSRVIRALLMGGMKESQEGCAVWKHTDPDVFGAFAQFGYSNTYTLDKDCQVQSISANTVTAGINWEEITAGIKKLIEAQRNSLPLPPLRYPEFHFISKCISRLVHGLSSSGRVRTSEPTVSFELILRFHARVLIFADCYCLTGLFDLAKHYLEQCMYSKAEEPLRCGDVISLLWFCYSQDVPDCLREIAIKYAATYFEYYWPMKKFRYMVCKITELEQSLLVELKKRHEKVEQQCRELIADEGTPR